MRTRSCSIRRRGAVAPLTAFLMIGLLGVLALAIDIGMMAIARNQCQNAADAAALAGGRSLNGQTGNNTGTAVANAAIIAGYNTVLGNPIGAGTTSSIGSSATSYSAGNVTITAGDYYYNSNHNNGGSNPKGGFDILLGGVQSGDNWTLIQAQVSFNATTQGNGVGGFSSAFGKVFGVQGFNATATATAAHRPRDIVVVQDFSSSMRYDSMVAMPKNGAGRWVSMLPTMDFPLFGHYSDAAGARLSAASTAGNPPQATEYYPPKPTTNWGWSGMPGLTQPTGGTAEPNFVNDTGEICAPSNVVNATGDGAAVSDYFYTTTMSGTVAGSNQAFTVRTGDSLTVPVSGDNFPAVNFNTTGSSGSPTYAATVNDVLAPALNGAAAPMSSPVLKAAGGSPNTGFDLVWEVDGYAGYYQGQSVFTSGGSHPLLNKTEYSKLPYLGYTQGQGAFGVTFMTWPPDPRIPPDPNRSGYPNYVLNDPNINSKAPYIINAMFGFDPVTGMNKAGKSVVGTYVEALYYKNPTFKGTFPAGVTAPSKWTDWYGQGLSNLQTFLTYNSKSATAVDTAGFYGLGATSGAFTGYGATAGLAVGATNPLAQVYEMMSRFYNRGQPAGANGPYGNAATSYFAADWRARFFMNWAGSTYVTGASLPSQTPLIDNTKLWNSGSGTWNPPVDSGYANKNYTINYDALLAWLANNQALASNPLGMSTQMHAGGILYYSTIPSTFTTYSAMNFPNNNLGGNPSGGSNDEMFWIMYINQTLGFVEQHNSNGNWYDVVCSNGGNNPTNTNIPPASPPSANYTCLAGLGPDWTWLTTTMKINSPPSFGPLPPSGGYPDPTPPTAGMYMNYADNPPRPKSKGWFGPLSMLDFIGNVDIGRYWFPGTCTESPCYQCKLCVQASLNDIQVNHPNDNIAVVFFGQDGEYQYAQAPLGRSYTQLNNAEWFAPWTYSSSGGNKTTEFSVFDGGAGKINQVPRANGGTCYAYGLMVAFNQFSVNPSLLTMAGGSLPSGTAGGNGRIGAARLVIMESDGVNKDPGARPFAGGGTGQTSWYDLTSGNTSSNGTSIGAPGTVSYASLKWSVSGATGPMADAENVAAQLCSDISQNGMSTARKPVILHCIAFGSLFNPTNPSSTTYTPQASTNAATVCLNMMSNLEIMGSVQTLGSPITDGSGGPCIDPQYIITGVWNQTPGAGNPPNPLPGRQQKMQAAFQNVMQDGVQVVLIASGAGQP